MAQGFNMGRYIPPDLEGTQSFNQASGKGHALGARARKLKSEGVLVVRFECPFAIWCTNCQPEQIIGQGVRFNAEKKKVGNYYSTPIWSFTFKHTLCGKTIEVRTDPKNAEYVVVGGGRKRDTGENKLLDGEIRIGVSEEEKDRLEKEGGFGALEKKIEDKKAHDSQQKRIDELTKVSDRDWADPYEMSRRLRKEFRVGRRQRQADEKSGNALQDKFGLGVDMLAPDEEDAQRAKYIGFGEVAADSTSTKPMFASHSNTPVRIPEKDRGKRGKRNEASTPIQKLALGSTLRDNTRVAVDPFLEKEQPWEPRIKRKRIDGPPNDLERSDADTLPQETKGVPLVAYDSDSS